MSTDLPRNTAKPIAVAQKQWLPRTLTPSAGASWPLAGSPKVRALRPVSSQPETNHASAFCKDLLTNPAVRGVHDVAHKITAVASLQGPSRGADFLKSIDGPTDAATYGTYAELVADPNVDIIYVATPHSHHFQNAMLALEAGKNVLCEKAFTVTESQARKLVDKAKEKGVFLMEAVWTRFFPWSIKIRELVKSGEIGTVHRVLGMFLTLAL